MADFKHESEVLDQMEASRERMLNSSPRMYTASPGHQQREAARSVLPEGASLYPERKTGSAWNSAGGMGGSSMSGAAGGGSTMFHLQRPYYPEWESPDRIQYPQERRYANHIWRLFYKYDPIFGNALEMYADMLVSDFELNIPGDNSPEIKRTLEYMCERCKIVEVLKHMVIQYLMIGEVFPHTYYSDDLGIWTYVALHDPDYIDVKYAPFINMDPIISFEPDYNLRAMISDGSIEAQEIRRKLPQEFVSKVLAGQKIRLSPTNVSFIARKLNPYDIRGTSLGSRLWRIFMVEDAVYNSTIATFRRHASPIKVVKLGDQARGWIPGPEKEAEMLEMLAKAETDPNCFVPETPVTRADGTLMPICELKVGDRLLNKDGQFCTVEVLQEETTEEIVNLSIVGEPDPIRCTPTHKWPVFGTPRECLCGCGEAPFAGCFMPEHSWRLEDRTYVVDPKLPQSIVGKRRQVFEGAKLLEERVLAKDIRPGDYLMIPRGFEVHVPEGVTEEHARLLGYYVAEGNGNKIYEREDGSIRRGVSLSFGSDEVDTYVRDCQCIVESLCGYEPTVTMFKDKNACRINVHRNSSSDLCDWLIEHGGSYAQRKTLSEQVMHWPLYLKYEFLKGYIGGDGSSIARKPGSDTRYIEVGSASLQLIKQVKLMIAQLGSYASYTYRQNRGFGDGPLYRLHVHGEMAAQLSRDAKFKECRTPRPSPQWFADDDYVYVQVSDAQVVRCAEPQKVVNMTVSGDHTYLANGFATRNSWICYNYGVQFEAWGTTERSVSIRQEYDVIEKVKLSALGLSKSFMSGEQTYASAKSGLQVFLRRLLSLRHFIETTWLLPKFFKPIAIMNGWVSTTNSDNADTHVIKRTASTIEEETNYIVPTIKWGNRLDPNVDSDLLAAYTQLEKGFGIKLAKSTVMSTVGLKHEEEEVKVIEEFKADKARKEQLLGKALEKEFDEATGAGEGAKPGGAPGSGAKPPGADGKGPSKGDASSPPGSADKPGDSGALAEPIESPGEDIPAI